MSTAANRRRRKSSSAAPAKDQTRLRIEKMEAEREERKRQMLARKQERAQEEQRNLAAGNPGDVDFIGMVRKWRQEHAADAQPFRSDHPGLSVCVRKRPISDKEREKNDHDSVTCLNPAVWIHSAKLRVDGITKYLDHNSFHFDNAFDETVTTDEVYKHTAMPLLDFVCSGVGGRSTCFAYGQTGSGKTHTMNGIQEILCEDLYLLLSEGGIEGGCTLDDTYVAVSFFEMYGGCIQDLLNERKKLRVLEDGKGEIRITDLTEREAHDPQDFLEILQTGNGTRTTFATEANDSSSRSHAICQIMLRDRNTDKLRGKFSLVDLAGSERGSDTKSHNAQRRNESADINTSLLSLKECIRALDMNKKGQKHVPYRGSKLTLILKDCFTSERAMTTMIATISPGALSADHSINTLRYADRIKEKRGPGSATVGRRTPPRRTIGTRNSNSNNDSNRSKPRSSQTESAGKETQPSVGERVLGNTPNQQAALSDSLDWTDDEDQLDDDDDANLITPFDDGMQQPKATAQSERHTEEKEAETPVTIEQQEAILNLHMSNIQENAELLTREGVMIQQVERDDVTDEMIESYVSELEGILERKEDMILAMQEHLMSFRNHKAAEAGLQQE